MKLRKCSGCDRDLTTKNVTKLGRWGEYLEFLMFNCKACKSTISIKKQGAK